MDGEMLFIEQNRRGKKLLMLERRVGYTGTKAIIWGCAAESQVKAIEDSFFTLL